MKIEDQIGSFNFSLAPICVKVGIDPTTPNLHLGHLLPLLAAKHITEMFENVNVDIVMGDFTAQIGDPTGRVADRPAIDFSDTAHNIEKIKSQLSEVECIRGMWRSFNCTVVRNSTFEHAKDVSALMGMLGQISSSRILSRKTTAMRQESDNPMSLAEFIYPAIQAMDSHHLNTDIEIGGADQRTNCLLGRELMEKNGKTPQSIILTPLLMGTDGKKMSKSAGNSIDLSMDADEIFAKTMSISDDLMVNWQEVLFNTPLPNMPPMEQKLALAESVTEMIRGAEAAGMARRGWIKRFRHKSSEPTEMFEIGEGNVMTILDFLLLHGCVSSRSEVRRLLEQGAIKINDEVSDSVDLLVEPGDVVRKGKKIFVKIVE